MLLKEIKNIFHKELEALYPADEVNSFFYILMEHFLHLERFALVLQPNLMITKEEEQPLFEALAQLKLERPIQYITGTAYFMDLPFLVNEHVLIPRPETEELVQWIISECHDNKRPGAGDLVMLDIGTGSGCIAIAMAKYLPRAKLYALDFSDATLKVAQYNARQNNVSIEFIRADIFAIAEFPALFDIIVSNPPYVREKEKAQMQRNVVAYEPEKALFVPDNDPHVFYRRIMEVAAKNLKDHGTIFFEINQYLGRETAALVETFGFKEIEMRTDVFGNLRMLKGVWKTDG